ncbi:MAG: cysteine--tRNA ligase [Bacteroidetes bacterium]|nr:cysteine--tRNA ligase [Bacteroidota bacterium]
MNGVKIYNTLTKKKEDFEPIAPPHVGLYVCGPTVYGAPHLGHARPAITFDVVTRFLNHIGFKVRYVSNITDVGHLEDEVAETGEDKIAKKARLEKVEPMEIVNYYTNMYHDSMRKMNIRPVSIEPHASGHIIEQIKMIETILENGYGYVENGSVYFDVIKYNEKHDYGKLSGRVLEDLRSGERKLESQDEKHNVADFSLWKKASKEHIMRWDSPWGEGFPGWHLECSVMGGKYLGVPFDIHGGGMDLKFPHHECEIAQSVAAYGKDPVKLWMHNNLITIDGQKMSKSLNNFITIDELFTGTHDVLTQAYTPMTLRFFILQTHYRSTLDFSNEALQAAEKGFQRLMNANSLVETMPYPKKAGEVKEEEEKNVLKLVDDCLNHMLDDFNTAQCLAALFELATKINSYKNNVIPITSISADTFDKLKSTFLTYTNEILGLVAEETASTADLDPIMNLLIEVRNRSRDKKDFETSDFIRDELSKIKIILKDEKDGKTDWSVEEN